MLPRTYYRKTGPMCHFRKVPGRSEELCPEEFHKAEDIVEMVTNLKYPCTNFETQHMPKDLTTTEEGSKIKMKMWEIRVKKYMVLVRPGLTTLRPTVWPPDPNSGLRRTHTRT